MMTTCPPASLRRLSVFDSGGSTDLRADRRERERSRCYRQDDHVRHLPAKLLTGPQDRSILDHAARSHAAETNWHELLRLEVRKGAEVAAQAFFERSLINYRSERYVLNTRSDRLE